MLKYFAIAILLSTYSSAKSQSIGLNDLVKFATLTHSQAGEYIITEKYFKEVSVINVYGQTISQWNRVDSTATEFIIKNQWRDTDRIERAIIHYEVKPASNINKIIAELPQVNFKPISKTNDSRKLVQLYENDKYTLSIYVFTDIKLPASIELHAK